MILVVPELGLNGATLPKASLIAGLRAAHEEGFRLYEPRVPQLIDAEKTQVHELLHELDLRWLPLNALEGVFSEPNAAFEEKASRLFALAAEFGVGEMIAVPGPTERLTDKAEASAILNRLRLRAGDHGISLLYEFIGFRHHAFPSLADAAAVARGAGMPLVLDTFHLAVSRTPLEAVSRLDRSDIGLVHLSDAFVTDDVGRIGDSDRVLPGEGDLPLEDIVGSVLATGYDGTISVEVFHPKYGERPPEQVAAEAHERATSLLSRVRGR